MKTSLKIGGLVAAMMLAVSGASFAADPVSPYVHSSDAKIVKSAYGLCWRTGFWTPALAEAQGVGVQAEFCLSLISDVKTQQRHAYYEEYGAEYGMQELVGSYEHGDKAPYSANEGAYYQGMRGTGGFAFGLTHHKIDAAESLRLGRLVVLAVYHGQTHAQHCQQQQCCYQKSFPVRCSRTGRACWP